MHSKYVFAITGHKNNDGQSDPHILWELHNSKTNAMWTGTMMVGDSQCHPELTIDIKFDRPNDTIPYRGMCTLESGARNFINDAVKTIVQQYKYVV